ncbi:MAG: PepSY-associated TM helix domain-containing protein [Steroidobacteraceae bacterium]
MKPSASTTRAVWLKRMHEWHWISSAIALLGLLFFALTGFTLNHATAFESGKQEYTTEKHEMPPALVASLRKDIEEYGEGEAEPTQPLRQWIREAFSIDTGTRLADWKADEIQLSLQGPGGDAWMKMDLARGVAEYHKSDAGWIAYLNDLHKGRHTGVVWSWFIDLIVLACVIFAVTGFVILKMHAANRRMTWPIVGFGILVPVLIAALFIH